jgi:hypothetical protein
MASFSSHLFFPVDLYFYARGLCRIFAMTIRAAAAGHFTPVKGFLPTGLRIWPQNPFLFLWLQKFGITSPPIKNLKFKKNA